MIRWRRAVLVQQQDGWPGVSRFTARLEDTGTTVLAVAYDELVGVLQPGAEVLVNTTAMDRALGTNGGALIVAPLGAVPDTDGPQLGHLVKARYTPLQAMVLGVDEQDSPTRRAATAVPDLDGMPVVTADLHSALPAILAALRAEAPDARVAYVMTDGGALPLAFSRTVAHLRDLGWLCATATVGQAYGGDLEAVTIHSALLACRGVAEADVVVVAQGPGNLGTDTEWGFSGVSAGEALNAAAVLGGRPVGALRVSATDPRPRHRGLSHHSRTAYGRVALVPADLPVPVLGGPFGAGLLAEVRALAEGSDGRLRVIEIDVTGLDEVLATCPVPLSTMGRRYADDQAPFLAAAAAGRHAAALLT